ncbi:MAG: 5-formyltetrahydrofolate cyclo-ligase [Candidatus Omnitrophica bacterium]|nr:5-formyltetrahydrofolate cyclo-ligase [Candidatus Omnitrophota bacterium]MDD5236675.1 5-formyltetrahydrofolate cyclo-ligase [Candidatus Omnitrophota bacterium]MDD5610714.1 5-formyltetrahydrofolate cyclo-ligase [Candidatus Omnitrophota bacterium]
MKGKTLTGLTKEQIRVKIISQLRNQKEEERLKRSGKILTKFFRLDRVKKAKLIMFFIALDAEVSTDRMIKKALKMGKKIAVPVCATKSCKISPCRLGLNEKLKRGPYGIYEPVAREFLPLSRLDVVVVPGIAFDAQGNRLGRGKGYYDRFLKRLPPKTYRIGLAFDFQILPSIPLSRHDCNVDRVLFA